MTKDERKETMENKCKYWSFLGYPESLNPDYLDILIETGLKFCQSPLHDKDKGKKPHYHFLLAYPNTTTYNNILSLTESIGATIPKRIMAIQGAYEYLWHKNNPEKAQYSMNGVLHYNGFNIIDYVEPSQSDKDYIKINIFNIIDNERFTDYCEVVRYFTYHNMIDELKVFMQYAYAYDKYLTSIRCYDKLK